MKTLKNLTIYTEGKIIKNGYIKFDDKIREIGSGDIEGIDMKGKMLIPGFIDQHIHGVSGHDVMDGDFEGLRVIAKDLCLEGTTSFLATTMTDTKENIIKALKNIKLYKETTKDVAADLLGVHLEGPFISQIYKGAQREDAIQELSIKLFEEYNEAAGGLIKQITLAPELEGSSEFIEYVTSKGVVVSIGHSNTSGEQAIKAVEKGACCYTHAYNGMSKLHHRNIGAVGSMFLTDAYSELICDRIHTSDNAIRLLHKVKTSEKIILITDGMRAKRLGDGEYDLGGQKVIVTGKEARLESGVLAGSTLLMDDAFRNMNEVVQCGIYDLINMSSNNSAKMHNVSEFKGSIKVGKDADLVVLNNDLSIEEVYCKGNKTA